MTPSERVLQGIGVSAGGAVGPVALVVPPEPLPDEPRPEDPAAAKASIVAALDAAARGLEERAARLEGDAAEMVLMAAGMARDPGLVEGVDEQLAKGFGPARALHQAFEVFIDQLLALGGYFAERVSDVRDVSARAEAILLGRPLPGVPELTEPSIVVARDLAPAETALLDPALVLGIVTADGGRTSHTAILAAQRGIPAAVRVDGALDLAAGTLLALDGESGRVTVWPTSDTVEALQRRAALRAHVATLSGPGRTACGHPVALLANIGDVSDLPVGVEVEGVGLFRTEVVFLSAQHAPSVDEQVALYEEVFAHFEGRPVTVRTLDAGADKPLAFANLGEEPNPALGRRGYRLGVRIPALLADQLEALSIASRNCGALVKVMAPMVATPAEARDFVDAAHAVGLQQAGVMIEVPALALRAHDLFAHADFASLGTNDLAQYTMAADRMLGDLSDLLDPFQPAVLDLVAHACEGAASRGTPIGVCGESAGDPLMALVLTGLGVTSLSMAPSRVAMVRHALREHSLDTCRAMADAARAAQDATSARGAVAALASPALLELL